MSEFTQNPEPTAENTTAPLTNEPTTAAAPKRSRTRTFLFAGGAVVAAAVLAGGGVAIGAAIADDDDDAMSSASLAANETGDDRTATDSSTDDDATDDRDETADDSATSTGSNTAGATGTDSAAELSEIITVAASEADGNAVSIDAKRDGSWEVSFETEAGDETEVRVTADATASVISSEVADADDSAPRGALDAKTVAALVDAALAEAGGTITDLEIDDDPTSPYDVSVLTSDGQSIEIELDAQMVVLSVDRD